jgi:hypothetical protein
MSQRYKRSKKQSLGPRSAIFDLSLRVETGRRFALGSEVVIVLELVLGLFIFDARPAVSPIRFSRTPTRRYAVSPIRFSPGRRPADTPFRRSVSLPVADPPTRRLADPFLSRSPTRRYAVSPTRLSPSPTRFSWASPQEFFSAMPATVDPNRPVLEFRSQSSKNPGARDLKGS